MSDIVDTFPGFDFQYINLWDKLKKEEAPGQRTEYFDNLMLAYRVMELPLVSDKKELRLCSILDIFSIDNMLAEHIKDEDFSKTAYGLSTSPNTSTRQLMLLVTYGNTLYAMGQGLEKEMKSICFDSEYFLTPSSFQLKTAGELIRASALAGSYGRQEVMESNDRIHDSIIKEVIKRTSHGRFSYLAEEPWIVPKYKELWGKVPDTETIIEKIIH